MFAFLLNVYQSFVNLFDGIEFNGTSILLWGMVPFLLTAVIRFVLPMLHIPVGFGIINRAGSVVSEGSRYMDRHYNTVSKSSKPVSKYDRFMASMR